MSEEKVVSEWALEWLERQMHRGLSKSTVASYHQWICKRVVPWFSGITLKELTEKQVQEFYESLAHEVLSRNSIWCGHLILRRLLAEAGREGLLEINSASEFKLSYQDAQEQKMLRRGQVKRYLEEADKLGSYPIEAEGMGELLASELRQTNGAAIDLSGAWLLTEKSYCPQTWRNGTYRHNGNQSAEIS